MPPHCCYVISCRAYEPRFGTEDNPIQVPALLEERIIGVTDPEDDTLVIWGVIREGEPPKQLVAGGEFFVLKKVERVEKVRMAAYGFL
jgi:cytochrome c oxidase subunit 5b